METTNLYNEVLEGCKDCIRQKKEENGGVLPIQNGGYVDYCWFYGGDYLHDAIVALMQEQDVREVAPILEYEIMVENVGVTMANRIRVGNRLREIRNKQELSMKQLANMTGLTQSTISKIERGKWSVSLDTLTRICGALGCRIEIEKEE